MKNNRYPGTHPFQHNQQNIFYGRDQETEDLSRLIRFEPTVVVHGKSGLGKSSLLNAAVIPLLENEYNWSVLKIQFKAWIKTRTDTPLSIIKEILSLEHTNMSPNLEQLLKDDYSLWAIAKKRQIMYKQPTLLVFDQFEELFTFPKEAVREFKEQMSEISQYNLPNRVLYTTKNFDLSQEELDILYEPLSIRMIFVIRSDRMHLMDKLSDHLPNILRSCYELKALKPADACDAIIRPAQHSEGDYLSPIFNYDETALNKIILFLQDDNGRIEAIQLQTLCQVFEQKVINENIIFFDAESIGDLKDIISNYYLNQIASLNDEAKQLSAHKLIEEGLVLESEKLRLTMHEGQIKALFNVEEDLLIELVNIRLLRSDTASKGGYNYELAHDTLIDPVLICKKNRLDNELALAKEKDEQKKLLREKEKNEQLERQLSLEQAKREIELLRISELEKDKLEIELLRREELEKIGAVRKKRLRIALAIFAVLATIASLTSIMAFKQSQLAQKRYTDALYNYNNLNKAMKVNDSLIVLRHLQYAETYKSSEDYELALKELDEALKKDSINTEALQSRHEIIKLMK